MERGYEMEEWDQVTQESLGNAPGSQKLESEAGLRMDVLCLLTCSLVFPSTLLAFLETRVRGRITWRLSIWCHENLQQLFNLKWSVLVTQWSSEPPTS